MDIVEQMAVLVGGVDVATSRPSMIPWNLVEERDSYALKVLQRIT